MSKTLFYTGKGDRGNTSRLGGSERLPKSSALIDTIGALDEATSAIGLARAMAGDDALRADLLEVQRRLYRLMSHVSATPEARERYTGLADEDVAWLEEAIARLEEKVPQIQGFVVPGNSPAGAACHVARATTRRAERRVVALAEEEAAVGEANLAFVNRLSSLLFVAALREDALDGSPPTMANPG